MKASATNKSLLPLPNDLKKLCKTICLLDAILCQEWEYRYYSYDKKWSEEEEFFQMRDGEGNDMMILFKQNGTVINGFEHELYDYEAELPSKEKLTNKLPDQYSEFIFGELIASIGTTYCIWTDDNNQWTTGILEHEQDGSEEQLAIFNTDPNTYIKWAVDYYYEGEELSESSIEVIKSIYQGVTLTKEMITTLAPELEDWDLLKEDINDIGYSSNI
ncbi:MAG: hypothetical protein ACRCVU_03915 [Flavobacterium sp.]